MVERRKTTAPVQDDDRGRAAAGGVAELGWHVDRAAAEICTVAASGEVRKRSSRRDGYSGYERRREKRY